MKTTQEERELLGRTTEQAAYKTLIFPGLDRVKTKTSRQQHIRFCKTNQDNGTDQKKPEVGLTVNSGVQISR